MPTMMIARTLPRAFLRSETEKKPSFLFRQSTSWALTHTPIYQYIISASGQPDKRGRGSWALGDFLVSCDKKVKKKQQELCNIEVEQLLYTSTIILVHYIVWLHYIHYILAGSLPLKYRRRMYNIQLDRHSSTVHTVYIRTQVVTPRPHLGKLLICIALLSGTCACVTYWYVCKSIYIYIYFLLYFPTSIYIIATIYLLYMTCVVTAYSRI